MTLFCPKSVRDEKSTIGFFSRNWWSSTPRQPRVGALRHARRVDRRGCFLGVVVNEEVFGLELSPLEPVVLDLILAEVVLGARAARLRPRASARLATNRRLPRRIGVTHPLPGAALERHLFRVGPEPLELIEIAKRGVKHVHDEVDEVEQHPAALFQPFDVMRRRSLFLQREP